MKKVVIIIPCFALILFLGCAKQETPKNFILLVDLSRSVDTTLTHWYQRVIRELIIPNLGTKDKLIILPIDKGSVTSSSAIFSIDFSKFTYGNEYGGLDQAGIVNKQHADSIASAIVRFTNEFETAMTLRQSLGSATNIIGAIKEAKRYIDPKRDNVVGLLSDMQQQSEECSITFSADADYASTINRLLNTLEKPDLGNASVFVITGPQQTMSDRQYNQLKGFWTQYFSQNNTKLLDYTSAAPRSLDQIIPKS